MKPLQILQLRSVYDMLSLKGKTAFITGAAGGIGRSCAAALAEVGANVVLMDIPSKQSVLEENCNIIRGEFQVDAFWVTGDVSDEDDVVQMVQEAVDQTGRLDVIFANAGVGGKNDNPSQITLAEWKKVIDIDLTGVFLVNRVAANKMKALGNGGSIINTASMSGHIINKGSRAAMDQHMVAYASAKAGVIQLTKSIAVSYAEDHIRCNSISPGLILSGLHEGMDMNALEAYVKESVPLNRFASLDEIVGIVVFLASELASYATGSDFIIDGGVTIW